MSTINAIHKKNDEYPRLLREIPAPPNPLYYKGIIPKKEKCVAIVGTRKATKRGRGLAKKIAGNLAQKGITVVSGLALGIDGAAHRGAILANGKTVAVLANGLDSVYPSQHKTLAEKILENDGALLSEYSAGTPSYKNQFLERNRIVSGLSIATVVIEAPQRSGSLNTAGHAAEQGREVFVVPGPANHPNYAGSHRLIRDGARLVTSAKDILRDLGFNETTNQQLPGMENMDKKERKILKIIKNNPNITAEKIVKKSNILPATVNGKLGMLTLKGVVREESGRFFINQ